MTHDDKIVEAVARAISDEMEGPVANQDFARQSRQSDLAQKLARAAITAFQAEVERERQEKLNEKCYRDGFDSKLNWLREYRARTGCPLKQALAAYDEGQPLPPSPNASQDRSEP